MSWVQKIAIGLGLVFLGGTGLLKLGVFDLRPGPSAKQRRQVEALRATVEKAKAANEVAAEQVAALRRQLEAELAATGAIKASFALPAPVPTPPPIELPPTTLRRRTVSAETSAELERQLAGLRPQYEERLRAMGLASKEIDRVLQLLVEQQNPLSLVTGIVRDGGKDPPTRDEMMARYAANRAALVELVGPQGVEWLQQYDAELRFKESAVRGVARIERLGGPLSPRGQEAVMALTHALSGEQFDGALFSGDRPWTAEVEAAVRGGRSALWTQWLGQEGAALGADERTRIKSWFDLATEEYLEKVALMARTAEKQKQEAKK